jgi:hypothetical protein
MLSLTLQILGRGVRVCCGDAEILALMNASYGAFTDAPDVVDLDYAAARDGPGFSLYRRGLGTVRANDDGALLARFDEDLGVALQRLRADLYFVHAAALQAGDSALMLVAPSGGGKSTLCWALIQRGLRYFSDEFAPIDVASRRVLAYPRALNLKRTPPGCAELPEGTRRTARGFLVPSAQDTRRPAAPVPVRTVVFIRRRSETAAPSIEPVTAAEAAARIYANALNPLAHAAAGIEPAAWIAETSRTFEVCSTADLESTSRLVMAALGHGV